MTAPALQLLEMVGPSLAQPHAMTLYLEGEIGQDEWSDVSAQLFRYANRRVRNVVIDFTDVSHLDYRVVRPLMARADSFRAVGGDVKLSGLSPYLAAIFRSAGAHDAFDSYQTAAQATASFRR
jgi:anti-sigma B factor antagonist